MYSPVTSRRGGDNSEGLLKNTGVEKPRQWPGVRTFCLAMSVMLALAACATTVQKDLVATGGSRADGTVELSFEHGQFQKPQLDLQQGLVTAVERCKAWGYKNAEQFGGEARRCQVANNYGCTRWFVTVTYQCLGTPRT